MNKYRTILCNEFKGLNLWPSDDSKCRNFASKIFPIFASATLKASHLHMCSFTPLVLVFLLWIMLWFPFTYFFPVAKLSTSHPLGMSTFPSSSTQQVAQLSWRLIQSFMPLEEPLNLVVCA